MQENLKNGAVLAAAWLILLAAVAAAMLLAHTSAVGSVDPAAYLFL